MLAPTTGSSPLPPSDRHAFQPALDLLSSNGNPNPEITAGACLLGCPLGNNNFAASPLSKATSNFSNDTHHLSAGISNLQMCGTLFRFCPRPSVDHLLDSDFFQHPSLTRPASAAGWASAFASAIDATAQTLCCLASFPHATPCHPTLRCHHSHSQSDPLGNSAASATPLRSPGAPPPSPANEENSSAPSASPDPHGCNPRHSCCSSSSWL